MMKNPSTRWPRCGSRIKDLLLIGLLACLGPSIYADGLGEFARLDAERWRAFSQSTLMELNEMTGDFEGYAGVVWELYERPTPSLEVAKSQSEEALLALDPAVVAELEEFFNGSTGQKILFLLRSTQTQQGRRGMARSDRMVDASLDPERRQKLDAVNRAMYETQIGMDLAMELLKLPAAVGNQVSAAVGEHIEWAESPQDIEKWVGGQLAGDLDQDFNFLLNRMPNDELDYLLSFAESAAGSALFEARYYAALNGAGALVESMLSRQSPLLQEALAEYASEEDGEDEDDDPGP